MRIDEVGWDEGNLYHATLRVSAAEIEQVSMIWGPSGGPTAKAAPRRAALRQLVQRLRELAEQESSELAHLSRLLAN